MRDKLEKYIAKHALFEPSTTVICAVSGGVDSMVMLHALHAMGQGVVAAHVDHGLRGKESDADHHLVRDFAQDHGIEFLSVKLDLMAAKEKGESTQMAARRLRYAWFNECLSSRPGAVLATAHHKDDGLETLLLNMLRGTGLKGLRNIPRQSGRIVRPFLGLSKNDIKLYASEHAVPYREDKSNQESNYLRNRVRMELLPLMDELSGSGRHTLYRFTELLDKLGTEQLKGTPLPCCEADGSLWWPRNRLTEHPLQAEQALREHGLHPNMIEEVFTALNKGESDKTHHLRNGTLRIERERLILSVGKAKVLRTYSAARVLELNCPFIRIQKRNAKDFPGKTSGHDFWVDERRLSGAITLRPWQSGDRMKPWGMHGSKAISDILNEAGLEEAEKRRTYVLCHEGEIVWLVGHRTAEGYGVEAESEFVLHLENRPENQP